METSSQTNTRRYTRVKRAFRKRWVWVVMIALCWLLVVGLTVWRWSPKAKGSQTDTSRFKFVHCDQCKMELPYNKDLDAKRCPKCQPPNAGFFVPTEESLKTGKNLMSPWSKVYVASFVETVVMLGLVTFLLYRPVPDPKTIYFIVACPYCNQRLRYRSVSHGGLGSCSRCKRMLRFPDEDDAVTEEEVLKADEQAALAEIARAEEEMRAEEDARAAEEDARAAAEAEEAAQAQAAAEQAAEAEQKRRKPKA